MTANKKTLDLLANQLLGKDHSDLDPEEVSVLEHMTDHRPVSRDAADAADDASTYGQRLSDRVAEIGGSWTFIIAFTVILLGWMLLNTDVLAHFGMAFDPYPYIFLNLMLSTVAAIQAPIIMMSQNRQASKDRLAASLDFEVNLRAELEIMRLHEKIDLAITERLDRILAKLESGERLAQTTTEAPAP